jgi:hypothetical protein
MTTHTRMLASLALTAATLVTFSSDALARGGFGGMRSFSVARAPMVVSRVQATSASAVRRTSATSHTSSSGTKTSQTKTHSCKNDCSDHRHKPPMNWMPPMMPPIPASASQASSDSSTPAPEASVGDVRRSVAARDHRKTGSRDHRKDEDRDDRDGGSEDGESSSPKDSSPQDSRPQDSRPQDSRPQDSRPQGGSDRDVVVNDGGGTRAAVYPVATLPSGANQGSGGSTGGVTVVKEHLIRPNPLPPTSAGTGAAPAATGTDQPSCVYERTVQKRPDGGLQRVVLKVCPDA